MAKEMKVAILAGGLGTRLAEETQTKPKPMVEVGGRPLVWHILKHYARFGFREFLIALGYKGEVLKDYFLNYGILNSNLSVSLKNRRVRVHQDPKEDWTVHLIDTGLETLTGGRVKRLQKHLGDQTFMLTYGDGLSNVNLRELLQFHEKHGKIATITAVRPPARFGGLIFRGELVKEFTEKPQAGEGWINGGFMVFEPGVFDHLRDDATRLEQDVLENLARAGQLAAYRNDGFWQCVDTLRDLRLLEELWKSGRAPWKTWD